MGTNTFFDVGGMAFFLVGIAFALALVFFSVIIVIETLVLWRMKWANFRKSFFVAVGVNILSGVMGYFLIVWFGLDEIADILETKLLSLLLLSWILTTIFESGLLVLFNRAHWELSLRVAATMNIASYIWNGIAIQSILFYLSKQ